MSTTPPPSRRDLLFGGLFRQLRRPAPPPTAEAPTPSRRRPATLPIHRPPGAVPEQAFLAGCTRCDACARACPHGAILPAPARLRGAAGTPVIDPLRSPCLMCADAPCISACEPGVLRADRPRRMGTAHIDPLACIGGVGSFCRTCVERCPVPGALEISGGKPRVVASACTGCGVCQHVCPAPNNAIRVLALLERPAAEVIPSPRGGEA